MSKVKVYFKKEGIVHRKENDGFSILFNPKVGNTAILDRSACFIWNQCGHFVTAEEIVKNIVETFDSVKVKNLDDKVQSLLNDLYDNGFLVYKDKNIA